MASNSATKIQKAFDHLSVKPGAEQLVAGMVATLAAIPVGADHTVPAHFRLKGRNAVRKELDAAGGLARRLASLIDDLSEPSIVALADGGLLQTIHYSALSAALNRLGQIVEQADLSQIPEKQGRGAPTNNLSKGIANILAKNYQMLTDKRPAVSWDAINEIASGPFYRLVCDVFAALNIRADARSAARDAAKPYKHKRTE